METSKQGQIGNIPQQPWQGQQVNPVAGAQSTRRAITGSGDAVHRDTPAHPAYGKAPTFGGYPMSGYGQGAEGGQTQPNVTASQNTPPGLHNMPSAIPQGDDNLSFFTTGQLHPGLIARPKREADIIGAEQKPTKKAAYQHDVQASNVPPATPQRITSSQR